MHIKVNIIDVKCAALYKLLLKYCIIATTIEIVTLIIAIHSLIIKYHITSKAPLFLTISLSSTKKVKQKSGLQQFVACFSSPGSEHWQFSMILYHFVQTEDKIGIEI